MGVRPLPCPDVTGRCIPSTSLSSSLLEGHLDVIFVCLFAKMLWPRFAVRAQEDTSPAKIDVTSKSPVGDISVVTLIRTDTTLDHSQKAEKV